MTDAVQTVKTVRWLVGRVRSWRLVWRSQYTLVIISNQRVECVVCVVDTDRGYISSHCKHGIFCEQCVARIHNHRCPVCRAPPRNRLWIDVFGMVSLVPLMYAVLVTVSTNNALVKFSLVTNIGLVAFLYIMTA
jgi:hypothetical protein